MCDIYLCSNAVRALGVDVVTWRGHLTKLLTTPYETREGWLLAATLFRGTLYLSEVETEASRRDTENRTERHEEMMYWGYKFEQYLCAGRPTYTCRFRTRLCIIYITKPAMARPHKVGIACPLDKWVC